MTPSSPTEALAEALKATVQTANLLFQNSVGCAVNHHALDCAEQGLPGWLADCENQIVEAQSALAAYAASPAEPAVVPAVAPALNAWNWLAKNPDLELSYSTRQDVWAVHRMTGWINDPEWRLIGEGPTPLEAVLAAMAAAGDQ